MSDPVLLGKAKVNRRVRYQIAILVAIPWQVRLEGATRSGSAHLPVALPHHLI